MKLLALMVMEIEGAYVDFDTNELQVDENTIPLSSLGMDANDYVLDLNFTIKQTYD